MRVSWFGWGAVSSSRPADARAARAAAVKDGRTPPQKAARSVLDGGEHDAILKAGPGKKDGHALFRLTIKVRGPCTCSLALAEQAYGRGHGGHAARSNASDRGARTARGQRWHYRARGKTLCANSRSHAATHSLRRHGTRRSETGQWRAVRDHIRHNSGAARPSGGTMSARQLQDPYTCHCHAHGGPGAVAKTNAP